MNCQPTACTAIWILLLGGGTQLYDQQTRANCGKDMEVAEFGGAWELTLGNSQLEIHDPAYQKQLAAVGMSKPPLMPTFDRLDAKIYIPPSVEGINPDLRELLGKMPAPDGAPPQLLHLTAPNNEVMLRYVPSCPGCPDDLNATEWSDFSDLRRLAELLKPILSTMPGTEGALGIAAEKLPQLPLEDVTAALEHCGADAARLTGIGRGQSKEGKPLLLVYSLRVASPNLLVGKFMWQGAEKGMPVTMTRPAVLKRAAASGPARE